MKLPKTAGLLAAALLLLAVLGCAQQDSPLEGPFDLIIQTYPPTGSESTYAEIELYDETGALLEEGTLYDTTWERIGTTADPYVLDTGRYYIKVNLPNPFQDDPYALSARAAGIDLLYYAAALNDNGEDAGEPDDITSVPNVPDSPLSLDPFDDNGSRDNRYIGAGDVDWFTFELP
jgi:hypothetical protein